MKPSEETEISGTIPHTDDVESVSKERLGLWLKLLQVNSMIEAKLRERFRYEFDSTLPRFDVMAAIYKNKEGLVMSRLSKLLKVSNSNITVIVEKLVKEELVERIPVEIDRRSVKVCLTEKGTKHFRMMAQAHENWVSEMLASVDIADTKEVSRLLDEISNDLEGTD